ncbi:allantoicase [Flavobacterium paronense]|uniref:Probable allantoicase n=1 Tax=Flavobacterium paronense TaxID=1392775 RepID=A0ABV5GAV9_9FLAO|nr:allantoicase [Flavobacterium paronense]MDN3676772.1 allantoicase [Flavobacterium paronense]
MAFAKVTEIIKEAPSFTALTDLAAERLGGKVLYATDDFFAEKENLILPTRGIFITDKYTDRGKWMDGWESRRKRTPGHDWAIIQLATSGKITGFDIDTNFFLGNHPPHASIEAINLTNADEITDWEHLAWKEILPKSHLDAGSQNFYECQSNEIYTHLRLHIYPDGGVARFRVYGEVFKNWDVVSTSETIDLAAAINGGQAIACNDMFFSAMSNLIMPNRGANMGDGWETKRNRTPNNRDWVILKLAHKGTVDKIIVDTCHFKGNYPDSCSIEFCVSDNDTAVINNGNWQTLLPQQKLSADNEHEYVKEINTHNAITHVRLNIFPDGGISRLRLFGKISK